MEICFSETFIYSTLFAVAALGECICPLCICIDLHRTKMRVKQQFDRKESLKMLLWLFLMECLARVHVTRLTVWQSLSNFKLHPTLQKSKGVDSVWRQVSRWAENLFFLSSPVMIKFFLCEEKLQTLCSNSTQTALYLAVRVKTPTVNAPDSWNRMPMSRSAPSCHVCCSF